MRIRRPEKQQRSLLWLFLSLHKLVDNPCFCRYKKKRMKWDEAKRARNLAKHGLDFAHASLVLDNPLRLDVETVRNNERRMQSFAYVFNRLAVLTVVHTGEDQRIISFRRASREGREVYHEWLAYRFE